MKNIIRVKFFFESKVEIFPRTKATLLGSIYFLSLEGKTHVAIFPAASTTAEKQKMDQKESRKAVQRF